jgi:hypothetical protein
MTNGENQAHMKLCAMLAAPSIAGDDLTRMTTGVTAILTDREVMWCSLRRAIQHCRTPAPDEMFQALEVDALKGNDGDQAYKLPANADLTRYNTTIRSSFTASTSGRCLAQSVSKHSKEGTDVIDSYVAHHH